MSSTSRANDAWEDILTHSAARQGLSLLELGLNRQGQSGWVTNSLKQETLPLKEGSSRTVFILAAAGQGTHEGAGSPATEVEDAPR